MRLNMDAITKAVFRSIVLLCMVGIPSLLPVAASAQNLSPQLDSVSNATQAPIAGAGHDYQHLLGETVNFSNGSVTLDINFPVPKGRGITMPTKWSYNSASVNALGVEAGYEPVWDYPIALGGANIDGWTDVTPAASVSIWSVQASAPTSSSGPGIPFAPCNFQSGMTFRDMNGVTHNLDTGALAQMYQGSSGYQMTCGTSATMSPGGDGQVVATLLPTASGTNYLGSSSPQTAPFVVIDKEGTTYLFSGGNSSSSPGLSIIPSSIEDRNGNKITWNGAGAWIDTAGRTISNFNSTAGILSAQGQLTIGGTGPYTPQYGTTSVNYPQSLAPQLTAATNNGETVGCSPIPTQVTSTATTTHPRPTLNSLALPNGQSYTMYYGSNNPTDSSVENSYGLINEIIYPDGGWVKYKWTLPSGYNEFSEIQGFVGEDNVATGTYQNFPVVNGCYWLYQTPVLSEREVSFDGTNVVQTQNFSYVTNWSSGDGWSSKTTTVQTTDNVTGLTSSTVYTYLPYWVPPTPYSNGSVAPAIPQESTVAYYDWGAATPTKTVTKTWLDQFNMSSETTLINATNQITEKVYKYGPAVCSSGPPLTAANNSLVYLQEEDDWDFGLLSSVQAATAPGVAITPPSAPPTKKTVYTHYCPGPQTVSTLASFGNGTGSFPGITIPPQVASVTVENGSGTIIASTNYQYDQSSSLTTVPATPTQWDTNYNNQTTTPRANLTSVTKCLTLPSSAGGTCSSTTNPTTKYVYDYSGQPFSMTDPNGNQTKYSFVDQYTGSTPTGGVTTNTYLTQITRPTTNGVQHISHFQYSYLPGLLETSKDENGNLTTYFYDTSYRLTEVLYPADPNNNNVQAYKKITYIDTAPDPQITTTTLTTAGSGFDSVTTETTTQIFDGMAHVTKTITTDLDNTSGGTNTVVTSYDGEGHPHTVSNPYWSSSNGTTTYAYDAFGRKVTALEQDNSIQQWCYDGVASAAGQTNCHSHIGGTGTGMFVDEADENGNDWQRTSDSFGRLIQVEEPNGKTTTPSLETDYAYDLLNDLQVVTQKGASGDSPRKRTFNYDSLSRLLCSSNPENATAACPTVHSGYVAGTIGYVYDANSNLNTKTDARNITVTYSYDALNREVSRSYSSGEATACHQYDKSLSSDSEAINQLTAEWMMPSSGSCNLPVMVIPPTAYNSSVILSHDVWGHVTSETQCPTGASCSTAYTFNYTYDLANGMTSFNNGLPATNSTGGPSLVFTATLDPSEKIRSLTVASPPWSTPNILLQADTTNTLSALQTPAYDVWGHLAAEQVGVAGSQTGAAGLELISNYDNRGRIQNEIAGGHQATAIPTGSFGVISVNGAEQSGLVPATATVTVGGNEQGPVSWYPCGSPAHCSAQQMYDTGTLTVTINGTAYSVGWGQVDTAATVASHLAGTINGSSYTAIANGSAIQIICDNASTLGSSITLSSSSTDGSPAGLFSSPSFGATVSGSTFTGGGTKYDTGTVTVALTGANGTDSYGSVLATSAPVSWTSSSTNTSLISALVSAINSAASTYVTASVDASGSSINLVSKGTDSSSANYGLKLNITDTTSSNNPGIPVSYLPPQGFQFDASSLGDGSNGNTSTNYALTYLYMVPEGDYAPNSNLRGYSDSVMGDWAFQYDTLNRLTVASPATNAPSAYASHTGCWGYDAFGNRTLAAFTASTDCTAQTTATGTYNASNRITFLSQSTPISYSLPSGLTYDSGGNVVLDSSNTAGGSTTGVSYAYDGEGRLCASKQNSGGSVTQYFYDASGRRVAKGALSGSFPATNAVCAAPAAGQSYSNLYLLNLAGEQVTELTVSGGTVSWLHTNVWSGAHLSATYDKANGGALHFHISDPLGTRRVQTDMNGKIEETCQSLPFGENLNCSTTALATADDATEHHFTGKERDTESGNDYFGARYYASTMGRFLSPDWSAQVEPVPYSKLDDPQTLNLYAYVTNNPLRSIDTDGHYSDGAIGGLAMSAQNAGPLDPSLWDKKPPPPPPSPAQQQVSFSTLAANYPGHDTYPTDPNAPNSIWSLIGGHVAMNAWTTDADGNQVPNNTCAIRMSYDLNQSGLIIPKGKGTVSGADGKQYFLRVADLQKFLTGALGQPQRLAGGSFAGPAGSTGVISFNIPFRDATGHFTLWNGSGVADPKEPYGSWPAPTSTLFWGIK